MKSYALSSSSNNYYNVPSTSIPSVSERSPGCCGTISFVTVYFLPEVQAYNLSLVVGGGEEERVREEGARDE